MRFLSRLFRKNQAEKWESNIKDEKKRSEDSTLKKITTSSDPYNYLCIIVHTYTIAFCIS